MTHRDYSMTHCGICKRRAKIDPVSGISLACSVHPQSSMQASYQSSQAMNESASVVPKRGAPNKRRVVRERHCIKVDTTQRVVVEEHVNHNEQRKVNNAWSERNNMWSSRNTKRESGAQPVVV